MLFPFTLCLSLSLSLSLCLCLSCLSLFLSCRSRNLGPKVFIVLRIMADELVQLISRTELEELVGTIKPEVEIAVVMI